MIYCFFFRFRYRKYVDMASRGVIAPEKLPPSERAAYFHGLRTHYQIILWSLQEDSSNIQPTDWGWKKQVHVLIPIMSDTKMAPECLSN